MIMRRRLSEQERMFVYNKTNGHCAYCGKEIGPNDMQIDHVIPMAKYEFYRNKGKDIDTLKNMLPACQLCNQYKADLDLESFRKVLIKLPNLLFYDNIKYQIAIRYKIIKPNPHYIEFYFEKQKNGGQTMKLSELRRIVDKLDDATPEYDDPEVAIVVDENTFPATPYVKVRAVSNGFDYDAGKFMIYPAIRLKKADDET